MTIALPKMKTISTQVTPGEVREALNTMGRYFAMLDKAGGAPSAADLVSLGLASYDTAGRLQPVDGVAQTPTAPTGFVVTGSFAKIFVGWDNPSYFGHSYTEIWRAQVDDLGQAVKVGVSSWNLYLDPPPSNLLSEEYYYWGRHINRNGTPGPYNSISGTLGSTADDPGYVLELLSGEIQESHLYASLGARIDLIDALPSVPGSVAARVLAEATERGTAIEAEQTTRASADSALASEIVTLAASVDGNIAAIEAEQTTRASADSALATSIGTVQARLDTGDYAAVKVESSANADAVTGLSAQWTAKLDTNGFISGFGLASESSGGVPLSDFSVLADRFSIVNPNTTPISIASLTSAGGTATANTSVAHGRATGDYVVIVGAEQGEYNGTSQVTVVSSTQFTYPVAGAPATPATGTIKMGVAALPFIVSGGNVYINTGFFQNASITNAMIANLAADKITAGTIAVALTLTAANIVGGSLNINNKFIVDSSGTVTIKSAATGARLEIYSNVIKVYDASNVLRVKLGDLAA